ncbi:MAG TPA: N-6 DNA methylase [Ilumatobacter sp.]|nr:N-6 DNA methylase [Ilumatobacter sp.]
MVETQTARKLLGAWYTTPALVELLSAWAADSAIAALASSSEPIRLRVLDPSCGDGRLLSAVADRLEASGAVAELVGCDVSLEALTSITDERIRTVHADALAHDWSSGPFDIVIGNPPFLSQMASGTTRGGASRHGGGPYADAAVEFLALSVALAKPRGGLVALVMPQSVLGARDAAAVRAEVDARAELAWSWWEPRQDHFDAAVNVCLLGFVLGQPEGRDVRRTSNWTRVVTDRLGIPALDPATLATLGTLGDRAEFNANFRDEYYALVPAVSDEADGPPLVPSGLIDPGVCHWGTRPVRFAKQVFQHPRVDVSKLEGRFPAWAVRKLVPKVLVANQTRIVEAVADPEGAWLPGVPVTTATPPGGDELAVWELAAVLNSPVVSVLAWQAAAGTGMSTTSVRVSPVTLSAMPWPQGSLVESVAAVQAGDVETAARLTCEAYGVDAATAQRLFTWWNANRPLES